MSEATTPQTIDPTGEPTAPPTVLDIESARAAIQGDLDKRIREADMLIGQILSERKLRLGVQPDRKSTRLNSSHVSESRMPSSA